MDLTRYLPLELLVPWSMLALAYLATAAAGSRIGPATGREVDARIHTWFRILLFFSVPALIGNAAIVVAMAIVSYLCLREFISITQLGQRGRVQCFIAYALIPVTYAAASFHPAYRVYAALPAIAAVAISCLTALKGDTEDYIGKSGTLIWAYLFLVFNPATSVIFVASDATLARGGFYTLLLLTVANDVMQYVWGKALGRRKLFPAVSPGKTVGGAVGGLLSTAALSALLAPRLIGMPLVTAIALGAVVAVAGTLGDLCFSALKRNLRLKDSGTALPGHGGYLDRVDSLTLSAPAFLTFCLLAR